MKAVSALFALTFTLAVNAHFQLGFPSPRGAFVEDEEPNFCDGFTQVTKNRTEFPLSGGFFTLNSEHEKWSAAFYLSTDANPNSFDKFNQVNSFFQLSGEGKFCIPLDLTSSNVTGLREGQNVTIQMLFDGGDGALYQCSDLTLTKNANISSVQCQNSTGSGSGSDNNSTTGGSNTGTGGSLGLTFDINLLLGVLGLTSLIPFLA